MTKLGFLPSGRWKVAYFVRGFWWTLLIRLGGGSVGKRLRVCAGFTLRQPMRGNLELGDDVFIGPGVTFDVSPDATLRIGAMVVLTQGNFISALTGVRIGSNTMIGEHTSIRDGNHNFDDISVPMIRQGMTGQVVTIGDDCWIGRGAAILSGVSIGAGSVIGANSVVTSSLEGRVVAVGAPARKVGERK
jgi:acetyltransferase-like isoleucine patch superfamily enzyme